MPAYDIVKVDLDPDHPDEAVIDALQDLKVGLSGQQNEPARETVLSCLHDPNIYVFIARAGSLYVGMTTLVIYPSLSGRQGRVEDVYVEPHHRRRGLAKLLMQMVIETAESEACRSIHLHSRGSRNEAHGLYQQLGFDTQNTIVFRLPLTATFART